jgi:hypothetical protein
MAGYSRTGCLELLNNITKTDSAYTSRNPNYFFGTSTEDSPVLTLSGCYEICGQRWGAYPDNGVRMLNWLAPLLLLLVSFSYPGIGRQRFWLAIRVLGDPIGTTWWHLMTLRMWVNCRKKAWEFLCNLRDLDVGNRKEVRNAITLVYFATAKYIDSAEVVENFETAMSEIYDTRLPRQERHARFHRLLITGSTIAGSRVTDIRRVAFGVTFYVVGVLALFIPQMAGGSTNLSGGRIAPPSLYTFILPLVLLSAALGDTVSWKHCGNIVENFVMDVRDPNDTVMAADHQGNQDDEENQNNLDEEKEPNGLYNSGTLSRAIIAPWCGREQILRDEEEYRNNRLGLQLQLATGDEHGNPNNKQINLLGLYAIFPVVCAVVISCRVDLTNPTWFSCRAVFNICAFVAWCCSAGITAYLVLWRGKPCKWLSFLVLIKDAIVGIPLLIIVILSAVGWFNSCWCSSGVLWRHSNARVDLRPDWGYAKNKKIYIISVTVGVTLQLLYFLVVAWIYRKILSVIWSTDRASFRLLERNQLVRVSVGAPSSGNSVADIDNNNAESISNGRSTGTSQRAATVARSTEHQQEITEARRGDDGDAHFV